jgi:hypothetical protein
VQVWDNVKKHLRARSELINSLHNDLLQGEATRGPLQQTALLHLAASLTDIAYLTDGEIERTLESEALVINRAKLANHRAFATLVCKLHVTEVQREKAWKGTFEASVREWRVLRTRHAMDMFNACMHSGEFASQPAYLEAFSNLRTAQDDHFVAVGRRLVAALATPATLIDAKTAVTCAQTVAPVCCEFDLLRQFSISANLFR